MTKYLVVSFLALALQLAGSFGFASDTIAPPPEEIISTFSLDPDGEFKTLEQLRAEVTNRDFYRFEIKKSKAILVVAYSDASTMVFLGIEDGLQPLEIEHVGGGIFNLVLFFKNNLSISIEVPRKDLGENGVLMINDGTPKAVELELLNGLKLEN